MAAIRRIGKYKIAVKWEPNRSGYTPWALGLYVLTVRQPESRHNIEHKVIHIFDDSDKPHSTGLTPKQLGVDRGSLGTPRAFDAVIRAAVADWRDQYPNRTLFQELEQDIDSMRRTAR